MSSACLIVNTDVVFVAHVHDINIKRNLELVL